MIIRNPLPRPAGIARVRRLLAVLAATCILVPAAVRAAEQPFSPYADREFPAQLLFGETHVHSALSADAGGGGATLMPRDVYRFARGDQVASSTGQPVSRSAGLD